MARRTEKCRVESCGNVVKYRRMRVCHRCYQSIRYWAQKGPARMMQRIDKLEFWQRRMETMVPGNVRRARQRKAV